MLAENKNALPQSSIAIFFILMFSILSFSVLYSTLVLYLTGKLGFSPKLANSVTGVFIALNFALHLLGGFLGGRLFSNRVLFCLGMVAQIIGCILLSTENSVYLNYGLATFLTGSGLNLTCINSMLTQRFQSKDRRRETAFFWHYTAMNVGFFIGYSLSGYFQLTQDYQRLFLFSALGNLIAMFLCLYFWQALAEKNSPYSHLPKKSQYMATLLGLVIVLILPLLLSQIIYFANWVNQVILFIGLCMLLTVLRLAKKQSSKAREKLYAFAVFMAVSTVFWTLYQIGPMGLTHFIAHNVDRRYLMITIPPQWFQVFNTIAVALGGPLLAILFNKMRATGIKIDIPVQFVFALILIGLAFILLPVEISRANEAGLVSAGWIVCSYLFLSAGELLIAPIGFAMIGALAPNSLQGIMMGMWILTAGVGAALSSYGSNWMIYGLDTISPLQTNSGYSHVFLELGTVALIAALALFIFRPRLQRWINEGKTGLDSAANECIMSPSPTQ